MGDYVPALIVVVGGLLLLTVLVAVLVRPPARRLARAVAALRTDVADGTDALRAARRGNPAGPGPTG